MDQVLKRMEKAEGNVKKIKRKKRKSSTYGYVRKKKKKKKNTVQVAEAQQSGVGKQTKKTRNSSVECKTRKDEVEELSTVPAAGGGDLLAAGGVNDSSSSASSEDLDALMCT